MSSNIDDAIHREAPRCIDSCFALESLTGKSNPIVRSVKIQTSYWFPKAIFVLTLYFLN